MIRGADTLSEPEATRAVTVTRQPGRAELDPAAARRRRRIRDVGLGIGVPVVLIALWQTASSREWIDPFLYPAPSDIVTTAQDMIDRGVLVDNMLVSVRRVLQGYGLGAVVGIAVGVAMGMWTVFRAALEPLLNALYTVPKLALLPIFLTIFGFGEAPVVVLIAVTVFFFVWISTTSAIMAVDRGYLEAADSLELSTSQRFRHVLLPAALPEIFVGLRIAAGVSVLILVGVEFVIGGDGLGYVIEQGRTTLVLGQTYVGIVLVALLGFLFTGMVRWIGALLTPWAASRRVQGQA